MGRGTCLVFQRVIVVVWAGAHRAEEGSRVPPCLGDRVAGRPSPPRAKRGKTPPHARGGTRTEATMATRNGTKHVARPLPS